MRTRRGILTTLGAGVAAGVAGCSDNTDDNSTDTVTSVNTGAEGDTSTEKDPEEPTEEERVEEDEALPDYAEDIPVEGLNLYIERLEQAEATIDTDEIVDILEGAGDTAREQGTALLQEFTTAQDKFDNDELPGELYNLAKSYHTQIDDIREETDIEVADLMFNASTIVGDQNTAEVYPVQNGNVGLPTVHNHNGTITFGEASPNDPTWLGKLKDSSLSTVMYPQDQGGINDWKDRQNPSEKELRKSREYIQRNWSLMMPGVDENEDVIPHGDLFRSESFQSQYKDPDSDLAQRMWSAYQSSDHTGTGTVTSIRYDESSDEFIFEDHEDFEYGDQLPGAD